MLMIHGARETVSSMIVIRVFSISISNIRVVTLDKIIDKKKMYSIFISD